MKKVFGLFLFVVILIGCKKQQECTVCTNRVTPVISIPFCGDHKTVDYYIEQMSTQKNSDAVFVCTHPQ